MSTARPTVPTYAAYALHTIMPAVGWRAVYHEGGAHMVTPIHALALAQERRRVCGTRQRVPVTWVDEADEDWSIVGLEYSPVDHWSVCDQSINYCGLLPPEMTLEAFEAARDCLKAHRNDVPVSAAPQL